MAIENEVLNLVYNSMGSDYKKHTRTKYQISYDCPVCNDNKGNLEINYSKLVMKCWKCCNDPDGLKGSLRKLVKEYGSRRDLRLYDEITKDHVYEHKTVITDENYKPNINLPKDFIRMSTAKRNHEFLQAYNYLLMRGLNDDIIAKYDIGYCSTGYYSGRIIIPSYDKDGDLNYFVARSYCGHKNKYDNPEIAKTDIIVNQLNINWDSTIYLVEGLFDMIGLGISNTIPLLGKDLSPKLEYELIRKSKGYIVICLDPDAKSNAYQIYHQLNSSLELYGKIRVIDLPLNKDIAEIREKYGEKGVLKCLKMMRELTLEDRLQYNLI